MSANGKSSVGDLRNGLADVAKDLLERSARGVVDEKSVIGLLCECFPYILVSV